jgi:hypothetical protein
MIPPGDRPYPICPRFDGFRCPASPCLGASDPGFCRHARALATWRALTAEEQVGRLGPTRPKVPPAVRDAVNACPSRGPVLPISLQDDCGCAGKELSECREGKGQVAGRVTLRECLACAAD